VNSWQLTFSSRFDYGAYDDIVLPIILSSDIANHVLVRPKLDTGSTFCVFQRLYADLLGLDVERGIPQIIRTATGSFVAHGHEIRLTVGQLEWQSTVYFAEDENFPVNVVGRRGFLDRLRAGLVDYEQFLYVSSYDES
jgi:hypothetical protein